MKKRTFFSLLIAASLVLVVCVAPARSATLKVPGDYPTIQAAISAAFPGDKVKVGKGVYNEQVIIDKGITVEGSSAKDTIIDGQNLTNIPSVGQVRITAPGDVKFSHFTIKNARRPGPYPATRVGIYAESSVSGVIYTIDHNKIIGSNDSSDDEDYGFYSNSGKESLVFTHNEITQTGANPILLELHSGPTDVSHNTFDRGIGDGAVDAYFNMNYGGTDITTLQKLSHNKIDMATNAPNKPFDYNHRGTAITFAAGFTGTKGGFTNVQIDHNEIMNMRAYRRGIGTWNNANNPTDGNIVAVIEYNKTSGLGGQYGIDTIGYIEGGQITNNDLKGIETGIELRLWNAANATDLYISDNHIDASGTYTIILGTGSSGNVVTDNHLKSATLAGDASVQDLWTNNTVTGNK